MPMKKLNKAIWLALAIALCAVALAGCGSALSHYEKSDAEGYTVSVRYDANGGVFTTNSSIIVDAYNISALTPDGEGNVSIVLLPPEDAQRGKDASRPVRNGYFLAGWYAQRTETGYAEKWDFASDTLTVAAGAAHSAAEPVLTLYAAWVPMFSIELYDLHSGDLVDTMAFSPLEGSEFAVPAWNETTGAVDMYQFPDRDGYTVNGVYLDAEGKTSAGETVKHPGSVDAATGTGVDTALRLYVDYLEGEWFHIYHVEQFLDNASVSGNYILHADLDFSDKIWPSSLMHGNFTGTIEGNGHTISNVSVTQTNNSKVNAGLFGQLGKTARISDLKLENVTFTIKAGAMKAGTNFGLLAGTISPDAQISGLSIEKGTLAINSGCYFGSDDYAIGLVCGMGDAGKVTSWDIQCIAVGEEPEKLAITTDGNTVTLQIG